ncbi:MAG: Trm112 family protein [Gemmatimonadota bacterium]
MSPALTLSPDLLKILVCPKSRSPLEHHAGPPESLVCRTCRLVYAVQDGIPVMLIDDARTLDDAEFPPP